MSRMTEFEVVYGDYKSTTCEWLGGKIDENEICNRPSLIGKSYCEHHYHKVYRTVSEEEFEEELKHNEKNDADIHRELDSKHAVQEG